VAVVVSGPNGGQRVTWAGLENTTHHDHELRPHHQRHWRGRRNLYVLDGSFFPSSGAVNPASTIMANALRVGDHLAEPLA
jgi:hypothetical protein